MNFLLAIILCFQFVQTPVHDNKKYKLVWQDEFDKDGAPDSLNWTYDIGHGSDGWGNQEKQYYTCNAENVKVQNGKLIITAFKNGDQWTSARVKTQGKKSWRYGKIVFRAKLPTGKGTWPALWMLGENIKEKGWPGCGEIDVMEHVGKNPAVVQSALHAPISYGETVNKGSVTLPSYASEFHDYEVIWNKKRIEFLIDGKSFYTYSPSKKDSLNWPYDQPFFLIMNVAIGGGFGGEVDPELTNATMEVDYVRVYQLKKF